MELIASVGAAHALTLGKDLALGAAKCQSEQKGEVNVEMREFMREMAPKAAVTAKEAPVRKLLDELKARDAEHRRNGGLRTVPERNEYVKGNPDVAQYLLTTGGERCKDVADRKRASKEARNHTFARARNEPREKDSAKGVAPKEPAPAAAAPKEKAPEDAAPKPAPARAAPVIAKDDKTAPVQERAPVVPPVARRPSREEILDALSEDSEEDPEEIPDEEDPEVPEDEACKHLAPLPSRIFVGTRGNYVVGGTVYRSVGNDLVPYNANSKQWEGEVFPPPYRIVRAGSKLQGVTGVTGDYTSDSTNRVVVVASPFIIIPGFVIHAKHHEWFKNVRVALYDLGHTCTLGQYFPKGPFAGLTKVVKDIMISTEVAAHLRDDKLASGVTPEQVILLTRSIFLKYAKFPLEVLVETLLFHTFQRAAAYSEMQATTTPLKDYITQGKRVMAYREPFNTNATVAALIQSIDDITGEGYYTVNSDSESKLFHMKGLTSITRVGYVQSSDKHGTARAPLKEPGFKFELMGEKGKNTKTPYNKGCTFQDPYPNFDTRLDPRAESRSYQSVGSCFATKMAVIDHKLPVETERCFLRLSMKRPDEDTLRRNQILALAPALAWGRERTQRCSHPRNGMLSVDDMITSRIVENDKAYMEDITSAENKEVNNPLQQLLLDVHRVYMRNELDDELMAEMVQNPLRAIHGYIDYVGGPKAAMRHVEVVKVYGNPSVAPKKFNLVKFKPDEAQKYKKDSVGDSVLKFGRATISIDGSEWVNANPPLLRAMKQSIEHVLLIRHVLPGEYGDGVQSVISLGGVNMPSPTKVEQELWYRACLSDTSLEDLARVHDSMLEFVMQGRDRMAAVSHGDDIDILRSDEYGNIVAEEADIADNDGSYTDSLLRYEAQEIGVHADPSILFAQLANPLLLINPVNENEKLLLRSMLGMMRCSGSIDTTFGNTKGSFLGIVAYAMGGVEMGIVNACRSVGFNVTSDVFDELSQSTFLSKFRVYLPQRDGSSKTQVVTCFASIMRNFGRCTGDLPGSSKRPVGDRWKEYVRGVIKGYVNEPNSLLMSAMRTKYDGGVLAVTYRAFTQPFSNTVSDIDRGIVAHYYAADRREEGMNEYLRCVALVKEAPLFGSIIACAFVDRVMKKRYGMEPVVSF